MTIFFLPSSSGKRSAFRGSFDSPVKPGNDREEKKNAGITEGRNEHGNDKKEEKHGNDEKKNKHKHDRKE